MTTRSVTEKKFERPASSYADFENARRELLEAISRRPFYGLLTGPSGSGKTSLLREVSGSLDRHRFSVQYLAHSRASSSGVARFLLEALYLSPRRSHTESLRAMSETLRSLPLRFVLFVDEAHLLPEDSLQEIRLLAESELDSPPLLSVVFSGLGELKAKFESPALFPLRRRLSLRLELRGLRTDEVAPFLSERLGAGSASRLSAELLRAIFERTRGIPALVEDLAERALGLPGSGPLDLEAAAEVLDSWDIT